jgi:hypothetical protein
LGGAAAPPHLPQVQVSGFRFQLSPIILALLSFSSNFKEHATGLSVPWRGKAEAPFPLSSFLLQLALLYHA